MKEKREVTKQVHHSGVNKTKKTSINNIHVASNNNNNKTSNSISSLSSSSTTSPYSKNIYSNHNTISTTSPLLYSSNHMAIN
jgi:hypothetical protein